MHISNVRKAGYTRSLFSIYPIACYKLQPLVIHILPCKDDLLKAVTEVAIEGAGKRGKLTVQIMLVQV